MLTVDQTWRCQLVGWFLLFTVVKMLSCYLLQMLLVGSWGRVCVDIELMYVMLVCVAEVYKC